MNLKFSLLVLAPFVVGSVGCSTVSKHELNAPVYQLQCEDANNLQSTEGKEKYHIKFTNSRDWTIDVFWINYRGEEELQKSISPGQSYGASSYITHPWVVREKSGECIAVFNSRSGVLIDIK